MDQPDLFEARQGRDEGMKRVEQNAGVWFEYALLQVMRLRPGWTGTGEDVRLYVTDKIGPPHNQHAWGALVSQAVKRGLLRRTGQRVPMQTKKSHARQTDVYVKL